MNFHCPNNLTRLQEKQKLAMRLLESISAIVEVINTKRQPYETSLDLILQIILQYLGVEHGSIMIIGRGRKLVVEAASRKELINFKQPLDGETISALVARSGETEFIKDITKDKRFPNRKGKGNYRTKSLLSVPIKHDNKVLGVINVTDKYGDKDLLQEDISYLLNFSSLVLSLITQQKMLMEIKQQRNSLKKKNQELQRGQALQTELSRMLIHDIKGPLSEVVANLDILSYSVTDEQKEFLEAAQLACDRTVRMASDLGAVARIEDGSMKLVKELVDPFQLLEEALVSISGLAKIRNVSLQLASSNNLPPIQLDRVLIERVLQNLLINALSYSPDKTSITVGSTLQNDNKHLLFFVADQGIGIPPEEMNIVFEKYARLSTKHSTLIGTGLGLYFCRLVVEQHKGSIGIESEVGMGSKFFFSLPF